MPRLMARSKRMPMPAQLRDFALTPHHLAAQLQVASAATVSRMVADLFRHAGRAASVTTVLRSCSWRGALAVNDAAPGGVTYATG